MLSERGIEREWVSLAVQHPDRTEEKDDGTRHYIKRMAENGNRWLRVIVNVNEVPEKLVTVFFDRRLRRVHENQI
jgi:transposase